VVGGGVEKQRGNGKVDRGTTATKGNM